MKIAICDDQPEQLCLIQNAVEEYAKKRSRSHFEIRLYNNGCALLDAMEEEGAADVLLLDIFMPGLCGTEVGREIRARHDKSELIFLTTSKEFAVEAFALHAAHYLVKPVSQADLDEALDRACGRVQERQGQFISVRGENGIIRRVAAQDIIYIKSFGHLQQFFLKTGSCSEVRRSLSRIAEELEQVCPAQFASPCKGYLLNWNAVGTLAAKEITLYNGEKLPVARGAFRTLRDQYFAYTFSKKP